MTRFLLILAALVGVAGAASAQTIDTLTADEAVELALKENLDVRQAEYETARQEVALGQERLSLLPNVSFSTYSSRRYGLSFDQTAGRLTQTATDYMSGNMSAGLTLFDGFRRVASLRQADLEAQEQLLAEVKEFIAVGRTAESDLYQQQEALANSESQLLQASRDLRLARLQLAQTLGRSTAEGLRFKAPPIDSTNLSPERYDGESLTREALQQRADVQSHRTSVETAEHGVRAAKSTFWPQVSISGGYGSSYSSAAGSFGFDEQLDRNRGGSIGLSLRFPITGWLTGRQQVRRAQIARRSARLQVRQAEQQAVRAVQEAHLTYEYYGKQLEVTERRLTAAETALEGEEERYRLGRATIIDLAQTRARYVEAKSQRVQTRFQLLFQEKLLEYQTGTLTSSDDLLSGQ